jgi:tagatose 6-phosphate kinase
MRIARRLSFLDHAFQFATSSRAELSAPTVIRTLLNAPFASPPADFWGSALDGVWGFWPTAIQLNRREAAIRQRKTSVTDDDVAGLLREWDRRGVFCGIVTDGPNPGSILYRGRRYKAVPPQIKVVNPIGSGDSPLAGLVDGWLNRLEPEALFRHAMASAVANAMVWDAGAIEPGAVARWSERVIIEPLAAAGR